MAISTVGYDASFLGLPLVMWAGILTLLLVCFQMASAFVRLRLRKDWLPPEAHTYGGYLVFLSAVAHASLALMAWL